MRRLPLLAVLLFVGLLVVGDFALKSVVENRIEAATLTAFNLDRRPDVSIGGFPFVYRVVRGEIPSVTIRSDSLTREEVTLRDVKVMFLNVRFSVGHLVSGNDRSVQLGRGRGRAVITSGDATDAAQAHGAPVFLRFAPGTVTVRSEGLGVQASARLQVDGRNLVIDPEGDIPSASMPLPEIAPGVQYRSVRVDTGEAVLQVRMDPVTLRF